MGESAILNNDGEREVGEVLLLLLLLFRRLFEVEVEVAVVGTGTGIGGAVLEKEVGFFSRLDQSQYVTLLRCTCTPLIPLPSCIPLTSFTHTEVDVGVEVGCGGSRWSRDKQQGITISSAAVTCPHTTQHTRTHSPGLLEDRQRRK